VSEIFGISMNNIMVTFIVILLLCLSYTVWIALRHVVVFKMGMRNIPRRKAQTTLIVIGLMLSTLISTAALGMGDTIDRSLTRTVYGVLGQADELIYPASGETGRANDSITATIPQSVLPVVDQAAAGNADIDGVMPALLIPVPTIDGRNQLSTPRSNIVGFDPSRADQFGGLQAVSGGTIDIGALPEGGVVISEGLAKEIQAEEGDPLTIYFGNQPMQLTVAGIAVNSPLSGVLDTNNDFGLAMPLDRLQAMTGNEGILSFIAISNTGGVDTGISRTDDVIAALTPALAQQSVAIDPTKQDLADQSKSISSGLTGLFLVLGLFSIAVGVLLIILIFSMLAAERRAEMGMARAIGQQRSHLIQQFIAEGSGYALLSGLVGAAAGSGVIYLLANLLQGAVGDFFDISAYVSWRSIIVGYCLGVIMTFLAIVVASFRASQLNVVAAIRDLPDVAEVSRKRRTLVTSALLIALGALMVFAGYTGDSARTFLFYFGMSLIPFGVGNLARYFGAPARLVYSIVGLYLLALWFLPAKQAKAIFGDVVSGGDFEMFFLIGVFSVAATTMLITQNMNILLRAFSRIGSIFGSRLPAFRLAVAYPGATPSRTGLTIAMFSLIVFSLVAFATISENFSRIFISDKAGAGWDVQVVVPQANQLPDDDLVAALGTAGADTADIIGVGMISTISSQAGAQQLDAQPGTTLPAGIRTVAVSALSNGYLGSAELEFSAHAAGYADDAAIIDALETQPDVAVVDSTTLQANGGGFGGDDVFLLQGLGPNNQGFQPVRVNVIDPNTGNDHVVSVIGVLNQDISTLIGVYVGEGTGAQLAPEPQEITYTVQLSDSGQATERAREIGSSLLVNGAVADSYDDILAESQGTFTGFLSLIQGFMGLGLIVGIAAVGVIAFRSVIERRQQIGVLRAIGYAKSMVSLSFMVETVFVVGLGVISGTVLALITAWQLFQDPAFTGGTGATSIVIPWLLVVVVLAVTFGFALLMTWVPSRQAASIRPAEALRYE